MDRNILIISSNRKIKASDRGGKNKNRHFGTEGKKCTKNYEEQCTLKCSVPTQTMLETMPSLQLVPRRTSGM